MFVLLRKFFVLLRKYLDLMRKYHLLMTEYLVSQSLLSQILAQTAKIKIRTFFKEIIGGTLETPIRLIQQQEHVFILCFFFIPNLFEQLNLMSVLTKPWIVCLK